MTLLYILIGVCLGAAITFVAMQSKRRDVESKLLLSRQQAETSEQQCQQWQSEVAKMKIEAEQLRSETTETKLLLERANTELQAEREHTSKETQLRQEQFAQQLRTVQEQFSNLATKVLEQSGDRLRLANSAEMEHITKPLKDNLDQLKAAIDNTNKESARNTASLGEQIKAMSERAESMQTTATMLTNVIKGGNKAQGNWGERMLTDILDAQGYRLGYDYDVQVTITDDKGRTVISDETGKKMIPDVILHYPGNEDVVIDSKMSIDAYYTYVNTDDEALKHKAADDLVRSIRTQAVNLAKKDYSHYIKKPRRAIDFVIMFVPNEGALQLALAQEPRIWREAFERHVFITGQQNLMAILKIIQIAWRQYSQTENQKKVFDLAEEMMKRVGEFIKRFEKVGRDIETLRGDYDDAHNKAFSGKQSIVQKANELKQLGVKESANHPIPQTEINLIDDEQ